MNKNERFEYLEVIPKQKKKKTPVVLAFAFVIAIVASVIITNQKHSLLNEDPNTVMAAAATATAKPTATTKPTATSTPVPTPIGSQVKVYANYLTNIITVETGGRASTKFYISSDKQRTWDLINETSASSCTLSLIPYLKSSGNTLYFRGNNDIAPVALVIPKETTTLKIKFVNGNLTFENYSSALEYRVDSNSNWMDYTPATPIPFTDYERTGYTLQFRTKANAATRAGKIVKVKIPKRKKGPSVKVDLSDMVVKGLKYGVIQYRLNNATSWTTFQPADAKAKTLSLYDLLGISKNAMIPATTIDFRTAANDKYPASAVNSIQIIQQPAAPSSANFKVEGSTLTIMDASKTKPYEYTVLNSGVPIDLEKAKWKKVTNSKSIVIKKTGKTPTIPKDVIYIRTAEVKDRKTNVTTPASPYTTFIITSITPN